MTSSTQKGFLPHATHAGFLGGSITEGVYFRDRGDRLDRSWPAWMMHILASYLPGNAVQRLNHVNGAIRQVRGVCELWVPSFQWRPLSRPRICLTSCFVKGVVVVMVSVERRIAPLPKRACSALHLQPHNAHALQLFNHG